MVATPMSKTSFLLSQLIARLFLNIIEALIVFVFAWWYFDITIEGNIFALLALFLSGMICFTGLAVLVSSRTSNTYVGNGLINAVVMPMMLISHHKVFINTTFQRISFQIQQKHLMKLGSRLQCIFWIQLIIMF